VLRHHFGDPRPDLQKLYQSLVGPWSDTLKNFEGDAATQQKTPVLLWSLDGILRYLPMTALYDGHQYMVERTVNVLFTPDSYGHMNDAPAANGAALQVLAMGLSKSYGGLRELPGVLPELKSIVHDPAVPDSSGPMAGKLLYDDEFTLAALKGELGKGKSFPVVHIASHFVEVAGNGDEPYLMLGGESTGNANGFALTLSKIEDSTISFSGTRLLTLSACSTAKGDAAKDGMEMDSLGMVAQQKDAEAVMATLWDVEDDSTSRLMSEFYTQWVANPAAGKAEALRKVQMEFLRGAAAMPTSAASKKIHRGLGEEEDPQQNNATLTGMMHPFYWAPFVLIGNYR
jgi:CHAT domain-containing protein